ncbi:phage protein Gp36 family protein [Candidatus Cyanaurora vandensis]|uniref:phage protein Gp36 family protein n=1 Tax=Candidatus Cyanaurora vandensis TaxID=2714958 RepID=UPI0025807371|nr:phage protein Gp36 family protein [Candidatus Cyanaurora vandensis]
MTTLYVIEGDLAKRGIDLVTLTNLSNPTATIVNQGYLNDVLAETTGIANSYLRNRYAGILPLQSVPPELKRHLVSIALYILEANAPTQTTQANYEYALTFLKDLAAGRANLGLDLVDQPMIETALPDYEELNRAFTSDSLDLYTRDRTQSPGGWGW